MAEISPPVRCSVYSGSEDCEFQLWQKIQIGVQILKMLQHEDIFFNEINGNAGENAGYKATIATTKSLL